MKGKDQPARPPVPDGWRAIWDADIERWVLEPTAQVFSPKETVKVSKKKPVMVGAIVAIAAVLLLGWFTQPSSEELSCNDARERTELALRHYLAPGGQFSRTELTVAERAVELWC